MWIKLLNQSIHSGGKEEGRRNINVFRMEFFIVGLELKWTFLVIFIPRIQFSQVSPNWTGEIVLGF